MSSSTNIPGYKTKQLPNMSPEQMQFFTQLLQQLQGGTQYGVDFLSKLAAGDEGLFEELEAPAYRNFEKTLGQIGTRFSHLGAGDSSYMQNAVSGAGSELAQDLQAKRVEMRNNAINSLLNNSQQLLSKSPYDNVLIPNKQGPDWGGLIGGVIGGGAGAYYGGLPGAKFGAGAGAAAGSEFTKMFR